MTTSTSISLNLVLKHPRINNLLLPFEPITIHSIVLGRVAIIGGPK